MQQYSLSQQNSVNFCTVLTLAGKFFTLTLIMSSYVFESLCLLYKCAVCIVQGEQSVLYRLLAQYANSVDLKGGLLNDRVCAVKFSVIQSYILLPLCKNAQRSSPRMNLEVYWLWFYKMVLHYTSPVVQKSPLIFNMRFSSV